MKTRELCFYSYEAYRGVVILQLYSECYYCPLTEIKLDILVFSAAQLVYGIAVSGMVLVLFFKNLPFVLKVLGMKPRRLTFQSCVS
jgi:hypothetical protein